MKFTTTAILISIVATAFLFPAGAALPQPYACSDLVNPSCGYDVCFAPNYTERPACANLPDSTIAAPKLGYCTEGKSPCYTGRLVCVTNYGVAVACVPDPCATTACTADSSCTACGIVYVCVAGQTAASCYNNKDVCIGFSEQIPACANIPCSHGECFTASFPGVCTEGTAPCPAGKLVCVTSNGQAVACVPDPCYTTACFATSGDVQCYETYWEKDVGPVSVVSRSSCDYQVYYNGQPILS